MGDGRVSTADEIRKWTSANLLAQFDYRRHMVEMDQPEPEPTAPRTHCSKGHKRTPQTVHVDPKTGHKRCRLCSAAKSKRYRDGDAA